MFSARMCFVPGAPPIPVATVPVSPTITGVEVLSPTSAKVYYTAPISDGGSAVTSYTLTANPGGIPKTVYTSSGGSIIIDGLAQGVTYIFSLYASNINGAGPAFVGTMYPLTTPTLPGAPIIGTATATSTSTATVSYTAPTITGTGGISNYIAVSTPGSITGTVARSGSGTITVTNLTPGTTYTFKVYALGPYGQGALSNSSNSITVPAGTAPGAPTLTATVLSTTSISLSWTLSSITGNAPITNMGVTYNTDNYAVTGKVNLTTLGSGSYTLTGLTPNTNYYIQVFAQNIYGGTNSNTVLVKTLALSTPSAPSIGLVEVTGPTSATVTYFASANDGGSAITSYTAVSSPGGITGTAAPAATGRIFMSGLTAGTSYTFTVYATNSIGRGASSAPSSSVTTTAKIPPSSPLNILIVATYSNSFTISFVPPLESGSSAITKYVGTAVGGGTTKTVEVAAGGTNQIVFNGLNSGTPYTATVVAVSADGTSPSSNAVSLTTYSSGGIYEQNYFAAGTYSWICPGDVTSVSVVCIGGGGGINQVAGGGAGGGALVYGNNISVSPGTTYKIVVGAGGSAGAAGGKSTFNDTWLVAEGGKTGTNYQYGSNFGGAGGAGGYSGVGGNGGDITTSPNNTRYAGGAGGTYSGTYASGGGQGGAGGQGSSGTAGFLAGYSGTGGGGGGGSGGNTSGGAGGGVGIYGQGLSGGGGQAVTTSGGSGYDGYVGSVTGTRSFGGGGSKLKPAQSGGVRIIWPGNLRAFPSTKTTNIYP